MTSRLTLSALVFSLFTTAALVLTARVDADASAQAATAQAATATRVVQLERVTITAPRLKVEA